VASGRGYSRVPQPSLLVKVLGEIEPALLSDLRGSSPKLSSANAEEAKPPGLFKL